MERRRQLDSACGSRGERTLTQLATWLQCKLDVLEPRAQRARNVAGWRRRYALGLALLLGSSCFAPSCFSLSAQSIAPLPPDQELEQLAAQQRWNDIVLRLEPITPRSASMDFYFGIALAQLGRYADAQRALEDGRRLAPSDPRFPVELAGIAFRQKDNTRAIICLRQALRLSPSDEYANNFLGTVYYLEGNLEAALKYWNRAGKPTIASVREEPVPRVSPALLDHAFAFSPAEVITPAELLSSEARLRGLGIFPEFQIDVNARSDGNFDAVLRARARWIRRYNARETRSFL